jgi:riboflavin kinase/FMN adenylyltransferase
MQQMSERLGLRQLWVGNDFALGRNRQGDLPRLREIGAQLGYSLHVIDEVQAESGSDTIRGGVTNRGGGERISSSRIRSLVTQGQVSQAAAMLGRPYAVKGPVAHGDERGRTLGFPTANVAFWPGQITPAYGVYATWTWLDPDGKAPKRIPSVTSVGVRPTFDPPDTTPLVEAHLIDFAGDLYDQTVRVDFLEFLRPELRFSSAQALIDQMILDTQNAREVLAHAA